jgi:NAD(P)-dependent dehydrogenase (short-subunit alcohol dehydrogenase family)
LKNLIGLENKVCIITGAGKGFGYEIAKTFAEQGCKLALISRTKSDLENLEKDLNIDKEKLFWMEGDVSNPVTIKNFVIETITKYGKIDILINNAGMRFRKNFLDISHDEWQNVMNVNVGSTFLLCKEVGHYMVKQKSGKIINMASIVGTLGLGELSCYGASKGAIISLTKSLAVEWAPYNINVNVLAPGFCETSYAENFKTKTELYNFTLERTPMKKWGTSADIANACVYLSSEMSSYITGEVLNVDGGWSAW